MAKTHRHSKARCNALVSRKIRKNIKEGRSRKQAIAISLSQARKKGCKIPKIKRRR